MQCIFPLEIITKDIHTLISSKKYNMFVIYLWTICTTICRTAPMIQGTRFAFCGICFYKSENNTLDRIICTFKPFQYKWQHLSCSSTAPCVVCAGFCPNEQPLKYTHFKVTLFGGYRNQHWNGGEEWARQTQLCAAETLSTSLEFADVCQIWLITCWGVLDIFQCSIWDTESVCTWTIHGDTYRICLSDHSCVDQCVAHVHE